MTSNCFGDFILPPTTIIEKHEKIGNALRSYPALTKLIEVVEDNFQFLVVGGWGR